MRATLRLVKLPPLSLFLEVLSHNSCIRAPRSKECPQADRFLDEPNNSDYYLLVGIKYS